MHEVVESKRQQIESLCREPSVRRLDVFGSLSAAPPMPRRGRAGSRDGRGRMSVSPRVATAMVWPSPAVNPTSYPPFLASGNSPHIACDQPVSRDVAREDNELMFAVHPFLTCFSSRIFRSSI